MANGIITRLKRDAGFGFIRESEGGDGDYFFHRSALVNVRFEDVSEGMRVEFKVGEGPKGPRAENVRVAA